MENIKIFDNFLESAEIEKCKELISLFQGTYGSPEKIEISI